jgi:hypothetical protein
MIYRNIFLLENGLKKMKEYLKHIKSDQYFLCINKTEKYQTIQHKDR